MNPRELKIEDFTYPLPDERIAKHPLEQRDACKLLCYTTNDKPSNGNAITDKVFSDIPALLPQDALLIYNDTRVINARLHFEKATGAHIEIFCLEPANPSDYERSFASTESCLWFCLIGNAKKWKEGVLTKTISLANGKTTILSAERQPDIDDKLVVKFSWDDSSLSFSDIIGNAGEIPIPPYLNRSSEESDTIDYQTVYSLHEGSVAAPTAGLHFTDEVLKSIDSRGIKRASVTLHVGAGTFRPVKSDDIGGHDMHREVFSVNRDFLLTLRNHISQGLPVVAVGTTTVRTLESIYHAGRLLLEKRFSGTVPQWSPYDPSASTPNASDAIDAFIEAMDAQGAAQVSAATAIIIAPGYKYQIVDGMITNFHQPQSTLLLLVSAFIGDSWKELYSHALANDYRFLSYGDACFLTHF